VTVDLNPDIFRQYDIRGRVGQDLTDEAVSILARAIGSYLCQQGAKRISLACDNRHSSDGFRTILSEELGKSGLDVVDFGMVPTPVFYYTLFEFGVEGGVMITGSHNPPDFNGFKIARRRATIFGEEIQKIRHIAEKGRFTVGKGKVRSDDAKASYIERVSGDIRIGDDIKVVLDCGNGTAGVIVPDLFGKFGFETEYLFCEPDGSFPNHHPDPTVPENLRSLVARVTSGGYDAGIAFDGDADRIGVIDENGEIIWGDRLLIILARDIIAGSPGAKVIFEVKCSQALFEAVEQAGGIPIMWKTGHSLIKSKMKAEGALLAGEMSGHIFFRDRYFGYDDAIYAALRLLEILSKHGGSLSSLLADIPEYHATPEIRVDCPDREKFRIVGDLKAHMESVHKVINIDGVRIVFDDGWGLVRASNTQPVLVLRFEAKSERRLAEIKQEVLGALQDVGGKHVCLPEA
jgi:phosphomannomutase/phosphoglucomutase